MYGKEIDTWLSQAGDYLKSSWGVTGKFAPKCALMLLYFMQYGLSPVITSGRRSPEKQAELSARYAAGDRSVVVKPATNSKHLTGEAIDISTNNPELAAQIASSLGIGAGLFFKNAPDPVHFYAL